MADSDDKTQVRSGDAAETPSGDTTRVRSGDTTRVRTDDTTRVVDRSEAPTLVRPQDASPPVAAPAGDASDPLIGQLLLNRYRIEKKIGGGGFGSVYRATDELKREGGERHEIAIKTLDLDVSATQLAGLIQEVSRSHTATHPNILRVYDIHRDGELAFMTMELLVGESLEDRLKSHEPLPIAEVDLIAERMCAALEHCHDEDLIHSDIKPANIFLCGDGEPKLLDLGIAQIRGSANQIAGYSPLYASPQQVGGQPPDPRDDLFSLSCVLFEALTGNHAFDRREPVKAQAEGHEPDVSVLPRRYRSALKAGLAYDRDGRPGNAGRLWSKVSPAARRRRSALYSLSSVALVGFVLSNQVGEQIGKAQISVSEADQAYAQAQFESALAAASPGDASAALVDALEHNPYHEQAAERLVVLVQTASASNPSQYSVAWSDFSRSIVAAPTSAPLIEYAESTANAITGRDLSAMSRLQVLSELRAPVCALRTAGYRADELARVAAAAAISC